MADPGGTLHIMRCSAIADPGGTLHIMRCSAPATRGGTLHIMRCSAPCLPSVLPPAPCPHAVHLLLTCCSHFVYRSRWQHKHRADKARSSPESGALKIRTSGRHGPKPSRELRKKKCRVCNAYCVSRGPILQPVPWSQLSYICIYIYIHRSTFIYIYICVHIYVCIGIR